MDEPYVIYVATPPGISLVGTRIVTEKNSERSEMQREHQRDIQNLKKEHKREIDVSPLRPVHTCDFLLVFCALAIPLRVILQLGATPILSQNNRRGLQKSLV